MIAIKLIEENGFLIPERQLTLEENATITSALFNGIDVIYYQGDEPIVENLTENVNNNE